MRRAASLARRYWFDLVVVLLATEALIEVALQREAEDAPSTTLLFALPALVAMVLPLFARRRYPFAAPAAYWLLAAAITFVDGQLIPFSESIFLLGMATAFLLGHLRDAIRARLGLAIVVGSAATVIVNLPDHATGELVFVPLLFGICWLAGFAIGERAEQAEAAEERAAQAEREREAAARVAVAEERARIARELHDVVAHAVSVMVLQVGAVRHKLPTELDDAREVLEHVEEAGRVALTEMRRLLGAMRDGGGPELAPQPGLGALEALAEDVGRAGLPVGLHVDGDRVPLPRALDLSAYRIVQEGLTNALKHARARRADVTVRYRTDELELEVRDDGAGGGNGDVIGHGLVGIRERVTIYGGELTAGAAPEGGFVLRARLPLDGQAR